jgi:hypothetical protein
MVALCGLWLPCATCYCILAKTTLFIYHDLSPRNSQSVFRGLVDELLRILINQLSDVINSHQSTPRVDWRADEAWYLEKNVKLVLFLRNNDRDILPQPKPYSFWPMREPDSPHLTPEIHDSERLRRRVEQLVATTNLQDNTAYPERGRNELSDSRKEAHI